MDWNVRRVCERGIKLTDHMRNATSTRGTVQFSERRLPGRTSLVGAFLPQSGNRSLQQLIDVHLLPSEGGIWKLAGLEVSRDDNLGRAAAHGQTWLLDLGAEGDLIAADRRCNEMAAEIARLRAELAALRGAS